MALAFDPVVAAFLLQAGDLPRQVLAKIADMSAVSGWALSKMLDKRPDEIESTLAQLRDKDLLSSDEPGLGGMYYLTQKGYLSRDLF